MAGTAEAPHRARDHYDRMYSSAREPWNYHARGAEVLRHQLVAEFLGTLGVRFRRALDIGCSLGQLTGRLVPLCEELVAFDLAGEAVRRTRERVPGAGRFLQAALPYLPFRDGSFDLVVASDAVNEFVTAEHRPAAIAEVKRVLVPGGWSLFSDYLKPPDYIEFHRMVSASGLRIVRTEPLNDRLWYQFESWFKAVRTWGPVQGLLGSVAVARALRGPSGLFGPAGSRHILILARKGGAE